jgi:hypothetical protein
VVDNRPGLTRKPIPARRPALTRAPPFATFANTKQSQGRQNACGEQNDSIRIVTWNLNHRAKRRRIPDWIASSILSVEPDVVVLTEYVEGADHQKFTEDLRAGGIAFVQKTDYVPKENQILIASRVTSREVV